MARYDTVINGKKYVIPAYMRNGLEAYVKRGVPTGDFLYGVLTNNFIKIVTHADDENINNILAYANWLYNYCPIGAWGSEEKVNEWINKGGLYGYDS